MKSYKKVLAALGVVFSSGTSLAGYDDFDCTKNDMMELSGIACVSCGIQKYHADKGTPKIPSEKWLTLLAVNARAFRDLNPGGTDDIVRSSVAKENLQKVMISQVQAYGVCTNYYGRNSAHTGTGSASYRDMNASDWRFFNQFITNSEDRSTKDLDVAAKMFGFKGGNYHLNMRYIMDDVDYKSTFVSEKRTAFRERILESLQGSHRIQRAPDDQGLRSCLAEVHNGMVNPPPDGDSLKLCQTMATSCDIDAGFCSESIPRYQRSSVVTQEELPPLASPGTLSRPPRLFNGTQ